MINRSRNLHKYFAKHLLFIAFLLLLGSCGGAGGGVGSAGLVGTLGISWSAPTQREDGSPLSLSEIETYNVYYGNAPRDYRNKIDTSKVTLNSVYISNFPSGTYYFVVTTVTTEGQESRYSDEIEITI